jgi:hypothetical protein
MPDIEDKLSPIERIRLESLAQAVVSSGAAAGRIQATKDILLRAKAYEAFIVGGVVPS